MRNPFTSSSIGALFKKGPSPEELEALSMEVAVGETWERFMKSDDAQIIIELLRKHKRQAEQAAANAPDRDTRLNQSYKVEVYNQIFDDITRAIRRGQESKKKLATIKPGESANVRA